MTSRAHDTGGQDNLPASVQESQRYHDWHACNSAPDRSIGFQSFCMLLLVVQLFAKLLAQRQVVFAEMARLERVVGM